MIARAAIAAACLALAGCGTTQQLQVVKVPVPVECREPIPERPVMPTDAHAGAQPPLDVIVQAALAEIELRQAYEVKLEAALDTCTRPLSSVTGKETP